jgi:hypothetical protein
VSGDQHHVGPGRHDHHDGDGHKGAYSSIEHPVSVVI